MSVSHRYKDFGEKHEERQPVEETAEDASLEEHKLQSFEAGYRAGWDDAVKAQADEKSRISAELGQNLQGISFTYHEAITKLSSSFEAVLEEIIRKLLPSISNEALRVHVLESLNQTMKSETQNPIEIVVSPDDEECILELSESVTSHPFQLLVEPSLKAGEVQLRVGNEEKQVSLDEVTEGIRKAVAAFFHEVRQDQKHG